MSNGNQFTSKIGLLAATLGSAIGLGSVWRFPAETQANGGAAFLLLYVLCVLLLGVPVMLAEFSLGRAGRSDAMGSFLKLSPGKPWWLIGTLSVLTAYLLCSYYMVVAAWTLEYMVESFTGGLYGAIGEVSNIGTYAEKMEDLVCTPTKPLCYTMVFIVINIIVLLGGVQKGIERLSNVLMPLLFVILFAMLCVTLTLPNAGEGVEYFLQPDFSKINGSVVVTALGQALFSLSVGMGVLVTYASYYPASTNLSKTSIIVSLSTVLVAVMMGLIIFPAVMSFGLDDMEFRGTTLVFVTLPEVFARLPLSELWSTLFFMLLFVAALTSTVSIAEVPVAMLIDRCKMRRKTALMVVFLPMFLFSALCCLSFSTLSDISILGYTIFEALDRVTADVMLPLGALGLCIYMGWFAPKNLLYNELSNYGQLKGRSTPLVEWLIRFLAPLAIVAIALFTYI